MPREAYTGSVGYISNNGKMDFNILVMLLDLERNDMGRVCEYGSVYVNEIIH